MSDVKVKFGAEDENLTKTLNRVQKELGQVEKQSKETNDGFSMSFKGMAAAAAGVAIGIGALKLGFDAIRGTVASFGEALDMGGRLSDLSDRTGETAGNLLLLERSFQNAGSSADKVGPAINKLQKFIYEAGTEGSTQSKVLDDLGVSMDELKGKTPTEQMQVFASRLTDIEDPTKRAALAMQVFGKSGGELLPVLQNFSGELANAKTELGAMPGIMDKYNGVFDTVSDKLTVIGGKMTEFAAGVLSKTIPALELVTTMLSRFDAAGFGEKLAEMFIGGQKAMEGFSVALDALKVGEFGLAFELVWASVKLQSKQTINEVYRNFIAGFAAVKQFLLDTLGPGSGALVIIKQSFSLLASEVALKMGEGVQSIIKGLPFIGDSVKKELKSTLNIIEAEIKNSKNSIKNGIDQLGADLDYAGSRFTKSFKDSYEAQKPLIAVETDLKKVEELSAKIGEKQSVANSKAVSKAGDLFQWFMGSAAATNAIADNMDRTAQNTDRVTTSQRATNDELTKTKTVGDAINEAQEKANKPAQKHADIVAENKKSVEGLAELWPQIGNEISKLSQADMAKAFGLDVVKKDAQELAIELQNLFKEIKLEPLTDKLLPDASKEEALEFLRNLGKDAIKPKIDLGAWADQIEAMTKMFEDKEIDLSLDGTSAIDKIRDQIENGKPYKIDIVPKDKDESTGGKSTMETIREAVEAIRVLVAKIEPKLPQTALAN